MKSLSSFNNKVVRGIVAAVSVVLVGFVASGGAQERVNRSRSGVALKGYDPVSYFTEGRAAEGSPAFEFDFGGSRYRFTSGSNRDLFAREPARYVPQYGGFCAYAVSRGYTADIDPEAWAIVENRLFLNYSKRVRGLWQEDIPGNIRKADANWPALRTGTR